MVQSLPLLRRMLAPTALHVPPAATIHRRPIHWSTYLVNKGRVAGGFEVTRGGAFEEEVEGIGPMQLYVGEGAVGWGPRLRFWAQTEITLLTLVPAAPEDAGAPSSSMETDSSHPSQTGGLLASVLLIGSVAYVVVRQMLVARGLLEKARGPTDTEAGLVQMETVSSTESVQAQEDSSVP